MSNSNEASVPVVHAHAHSSVPDSESRPSKPSSVASNLNITQPARNIALRETRPIVPEDSPPPQMIKVTFHIKWGSFGCARLTRMVAPDSRTLFNVARTYLRDRPDSFLDAPLPEQKAVRIPHGSVDFVVLACTLTKVIVGKVLTDLRMAGNLVDFDQLLRDSAQEATLKNESFEVHLTLNSRHP